MGKSDVPKNKEDSEVGITLRQYTPHRVLRPDGVIGRPRRLQAPEELNPAGVVFLTSIRDIGVDDKNGLVLDNHGTPHYMMGLIEAVNNIINHGRIGLGNAIRIKGIITDDTVIDNTYPYPLTPRKGEPWIHNLNARGSMGERLTSITHHIPSTFRGIPNRKKDEKATERLAFEEEIYRVSQQMGADMLVSDHLMLRIIHLISTNRYSIGRILNIHPGISDPKNPTRLPGSTPTQDAINRVNLGCVFKKKGRLYSPVHTEPHDRTGASLHIIDENLDTGPVIADSESTTVFPSDTPQDLRIRNYPVKITVFVIGIMHYVETMLRNVDKLNFQSGETPESRKTVVTPRDFLKRT